MNGLFVINFFQLLNKYTLKLLLIDGNGTSIDNIDQIIDDGKHSDTSANDNNVNHYHDDRNHDNDFLFKLFPI